MKDQIYTSFKEKETAFNSCGSKFFRIDNKATLDAFYQTIKNEQTKGKLIFRGINEAKYKMYTSLQRAYIDGKINIDTTPSWFISTEIETLKKANNQLLPRYYKAMNIVDSDFTYLSFLQHHRAPTPFLDFSYSFEKAMFFAIDGQKYDRHNPDNELNDYISLYWMDLSQKGMFIDIIQWLADEYSKSLDMLSEYLQQYGAENVNIEMLDINNVLCWSNPRNNNEGLTKLSLGFIGECKDSKRQVIYKPSYMRTYMSRCKKLLAQSNITQTLLDRIKSKYRDFIIQNAKLINLNVVAQDSCFILYNNDNNQPLEGYWYSNTNSYLHLPTLNCANIHKSFVPNIKKMLKNFSPVGIIKETIYPDSNKICDNVLEEVLSSL